MIAVEPIRNKKDIKAISNYYKKRGNFRNYLLITIGLHTALRISDILRLTWEDIYDFDNNIFKERITIIEKKTKKTKTIALNTKILQALRLYFQKIIPDRKQPIFLSKRGTGKAISRIQAYRIIRYASEEIRLKIRVSSHSLRKTFGYHAWKNNESLAVIMAIFNHSSIAITRRYLGICQDDQDKLYLRQWY
jgi:Site-specific recombinase XerD